jgi:hypothetical protein
LANAFHNQFDLTIASFEFSSLTEILMRFLGDGFDTAVQLSVLDIFLDISKSPDKRNAAFLIESGLLNVLNLPVRSPEVLARCLVLMDSFLAHGGQLVTAVGQSPTAVQAVDCLFDAPFVSRVLAFEFFVRFLKFPQGCEFLWEHPAVVSGMTDILVDFEVLRIKEFAFALNACYFYARELGQIHALLDVIAGSGLHAAIEELFTRDGFDPEDADILELLVNLEP